MDKVCDPPDLEITVEEAKDLLSLDLRTILIDIRTDRETRLGCIKGARFVAPGAIEEEQSRPSSDTATPVIVYCAAGDRSIPVVRKLRDMGFVNSRSLKGGYDAWLSGGGEIVSGGALSVDQLNRYSRNMLVKEIGEEGQLKLRAAKVLVVGAGGLGSPALLYLAAAGVGALGIVDYDRVGLSNLNRQVIHGTPDIGRLKAESAREAVEALNPDVRVTLYKERLTKDNAFSLIEGFDMVMDATDSLDTKFLLNDACYFMHKPYIFGGALGFDGQAGVFWPAKEGPCLRCLFPVPPPDDLTPTCSQVGVLGTVPGHVGVVQATEILKLILGTGTLMIGKFYVYNALRLTAGFLETQKNPRCPLCGENPSITELADSGSPGCEPS